MKRECLPATKSSASGNMNQFGENALFFHKFRNVFVVLRLDKSQMEFFYVYEDFYLNTLSFVFALLWFILIESPRAPIISPMAEVAVAPSRGKEAARGG